MGNASIYPDSKLHPVNMTRLRGHGRLHSIDIFLLFLGFVSLFFVNLIGQFYLSEIILVLLFPFLCVRYWGALLKNPLAGRILIFGGLWFLNQVFTDLIRNTPVDDMMRGWAGIAVFLITFGSLYLLVKRSMRRIQMFLFGYATGSLASLYLQPPGNFSADPWKFGFGYPVILLVLLVVQNICGGNVYRLKKWILPLIVLGGLSIYWNARSLGAIVILAAVVLWLRNLSFGKPILTRLSPQSILAGGLILGLSIWGLVSIYGFAAQKGYLGEAARQKYIWQESGKFGLLLGGRNEILASATAIRDAPIIGHGSWAKDPAYRVLLYHLIDLGYAYSEAQLDQYVNETDLIPAHSHLFQAWVWAGIMGAVFWLVILGLIIKVFLHSNRFPNGLYVFVVFFSISSVWDIFFSPFGSIMRMRWVIQLIVFVTAYYQSQQIAPGGLSPVFKRPDF
jgi:hypothetical protein